MSNRLRLAASLRWRELCLAAALLPLVACGGAHSLASLHTRPWSAAGIAWLSPVQPRDGITLGRWREGVGSPLVNGPANPSPAIADAVTIVSWNVALDDGDVAALVHDLEARYPRRPIVLLLQEVFRTGDDVPAAGARGAFAGHLGRSTPAREVDDLARTLGYSLYYVPSMRNGIGREDRGNAVVSSLPLTDYEAIELPFEHQRRVAVAGRISGRTTRGTPWSLRVASVHLDNLVGFRSGWITTEYGRARQARGLREAFAGDEPTILAGDFNTWFGFSDQAYREIARAFPQTHVRDHRRTFRGLLRLDHVFYRLAPHWRAEVRRGESSRGSDHYPLITTVTF